MGNTLVAYVVMVEGEQHLSGIATSGARPAVLLSSRQLSILRSTADGATNAEIAELLHVSTHTVKAEVAQLLDVFRARNRAHLVARAVRSGVL
jgi:DNA-binding NarL/FixJ family response regulator